MPSHLDCLAKLIFRQKLLSLNYVASCPIHHWLRRIDIMYSFGNQSVKAFPEGEAVARRMLGAVYLGGLLLLAGCQALSGDDAVAAIDTDLTQYAAENDSIRAAATDEQVMVVETIVAAGTRIARLSAVNAALGATLRAHHTGTPEVQAVVVSAEDMGSSLDDDMMNDEAGERPLDSAMRVSDLSTAQSTDPASGCSSGPVSQFRPSAERIYVTARVTALQSGTLFEVDWLFNGRSVYRVEWLADFSRSSVCIWFYATPVAFPFTPGNYTATLYADGEAQGTAEFSIENE